MSANEGLRLGAFDLDHPVSSGGMGQVWRGHHRGDGLPVAVKFVRSDERSLARFEEALRREVRAVAMLQHPSIVPVLDYGTVDRETARRSAGRLQPGKPFYVMEWFPLGALRVGSLATWSDLAALLRTLLDALAHAHARGVIHRDLKPANVLVTSDRPAWSLTDFGIAHVAAEADPASARQGTARYMAPEQCRGSWWEHGPWTDLYALGCIAFEIASGRPPFEGTSAEILQKHLAFPIPVLEPRFAVPGDFESWVRRMMARSPARRFTLAADALRALDALSEPSPDLSPGARTASQPPLDRTADLATHTGALASHLARDADPSAATTSEHAAPPEPIELTLDDAQREDPRPWRIRDAGLQLLGLRRVPLVGRASERGLLRDALRRVIASRAPACVIVHGPAGVGKKRLSAWLRESAHERGAAESRVLRHTPTDARDGGREALASLLRRHFGLVDVDRREALRRVRATLATAVEAPDALAEALADVTSSDAPQDPCEAVARWLERASAARPLIVCVDDAQWASESLRLAERVMRATAPIMLVVTVRDDALADRPEERSRLEALRSDARVVTVCLGPLPLVEQVEVIQRTIPIDPTLAARVAARTAGDCALALRSLEGCIARGVLVPGPSGFELSDGASLPTPGDVRESWDERLSIVLAHQADGAHAGLDSRDPEGAAAWILQGAQERYRRGEWPLVDELVSLHDEALTAANAAKTDARRAEGWELRARTYVWQGRREEARRWAEAALTSAREAERVDLEARALHHLAKLAYDDNECERAAELFGRTLALAAQAGDRVGVARSYLAASCVALRRARSVEARATAARGRDLAFAAGELTLAAVCVMQLGIVARQRGELDRARRLLVESWEGCRRTGYVLGVAQARHELGVLALRRGVVDEALEHAERAIAEYHSVGARSEALDARCVRAAARALAGERSAALSEVDAVFAIASEIGAAGVRGVVLAAGLWAAAQRRDWRAWDHRATELAGWRAGADQLDAGRPVVRLATRAARAAGEVERAKQLAAWVTERRRAFE